MLRSSTFVVGILLAIGAFAALVLLGSVFNPAPYQIVIAREDVPAYSRLLTDMLALDSQTMSQDVVTSLVTREELDQYLGGLVIESVRAGEPLRKGAVVAATNPKAADRLALMLDDADSVAMVVPVDPQSAPEQIESGDFVDIVLSLTPGAINAATTEKFGDAGPTPNAISTVLPLPTRALTVTATLSNTVRPPEEMNLPVAKVTIRQVPILGVRRERIANPNFSVAPIGENTQTTEPAFVEGDIQAVLVRIPRASVELLTFAMDNGKVHLSLLSPYLVHNRQNEPTLGISWNDVIEWMMQERRLASGQVVIVAPETITPTAAITLTPVPGAQISATPTVAATTSLPPATNTFPVSASTFTLPADLLSNVACLALPLGAGILLVIGTFYFLRRLKG
ncbi:MAG: hypothetical protein IT331_13440 [Anaerolineae bacterium]|nr:hypothetical protein [Anaerolineae bacterium]